MKTILAALAILFTTGTHAQWVKSLSIAGGYVRANQITDYENYGGEPKYKSLITWGIEGGATFWESKYITIGAQAGYIRNGYQDFPSQYYIWVDGRPPEKVTIVLEYLYLAPRFSFRLPVKSIAPYIFLAPRLNYFLSVKERIEGDNERLLYETSAAYYNQNHRPFVFGGNVGFGIEKKIHRNIGIGIEASYLHDFTSGIYHDKLKFSLNEIIYQQALTVYAMGRYYFNRKDYRGIKQSK